MRLHYEHGYWEERVDDVKESNNRRAEAVHEWVTGKVGNDDIIAEIGCGSGSILAGVRDKLGCRAIGVEPSQKEAQAARDNHGLDIRCRTIEQIRDGELPLLKLLILSHVAEHFYDPVSALRKCRELLADDGLIWLEVPNILNPTATKRLSTWLAFEHTSYFPVATLSWFVTTAGLQVLRAEGHEHHVRVLAAKRDGVPQPTQPNEYHAVRRALRKHELNYWPRFIWKRLLGK